MNGLHESHKSLPQLTNDEAAVRDIRKLLIDIVRQNGGGHGGSAIGMAPLGVALWRHAMRYNPSNSEWFDRDRVVLSNGHAAMFLYTMLHISGHEHFSVDELKMYADPKTPDPITGTWKSTICHGHPEIEVPGIEVTTGPLGQGIANAVGLAIASKQTGALFNKADLEIISSRIYCITGDGCLQEGVAQEAMAIAGHLKLDNLVLCYDNNQITCDGPLDWIVSEDTNAKVRALGWNVVDVLSGDHCVDDIVAALRLATSTKGMPTFINIRTTIGFGTSTAGTAKSHHGNYTDADSELYVHRSDAKTHEISEVTKAYFDRARSRGKQYEQDWNSRLELYRKTYPIAFEQLDDRIHGRIDLQQVLDKVHAPHKIQATRTFNGTVFNILMEASPNLFAGGADLWNANQLGDQSLRIFDASNYKGQVVRYGIREHAMASISNGIAAYSPGSIIPITATFLMFYLYAAPGIRMGALSNLKVIHVATHDSIGEGQNGPTHQPVEVDSLFRAMPNLLFIRPADAEEVIGAWKVALAAKKMPSIISLARDPPVHSFSNTSRAKVERGGYVLVERDQAQVTLVSCGSELQFAVAAATQLTDAGTTTRVISMPCIQLFESQADDYQEETLGLAPHIISVEAYVSSMWSRFCTASIAMDSFGYSGGGAQNYARFGLDEAGIVAKVQAHVSRCGMSRRPHRWTLLK